MQQRKDGDIAARERIPFQSSSLDAVLQDARDAQKNCNEFWMWGASIERRTLRHKNATRGK